MKQAFSKILIAFALSLFFESACFASVHQQPSVQVQEDHYIVTTLVDVTSDSAIKAQQEAMDQGRDQAFQELLVYLLKRQDIGQFKQVLSADFLSSYEVQEQKMSSVRFIGRVSYRFDREKVKSMLDYQGLDIHETARAPLVIVPILVKDDQAYLWGDSNPWLRAWNSYAFPKSRASVVIPIGDLSDLSTLKLDDAITLQTDALMAFSRKYHTEGVIVAIYRSPDLSIHVIKNGEIQTLDVHGEPKLEKASPDYTRLIPTVLRSLEEGQKQVTSNAQNTFNVDIEVASLSDWKVIEGKLTQIQNIENMTLKSMKVGTTNVDLTFRGTLSGLQFALQTKGLYLQDLGAEKWRIVKAMKASSPS